MPVGLITGYPGWLTGRFLGWLAQPAVAAWHDQLKEYTWEVVAAPEVALPPEQVPAPVRAVHRVDLRDPRPLGAALAGVDLVLHAAGIIHPRRIHELYHINRDATGRLARMAAAAGVRRFAYVSSNAAAGFAAGPDDAMRETDPPRPVSEYGRSKSQAEAAVWEAVSGSATEAVVLRPTTFYGPGFPRRHRRAFNMARTGRPLVIGNGTNRVSMVYIDNLVEGVGLALTGYRSAGQTYFLADGRPYLWLEVFQAMAEAQGRQLRPLYLPQWLATACAALDRWLASWDRYCLPVHLAGEATRNMACSIAKAADELGYCPSVTLRRGIAEAVRWGREVGCL